MKKPKLHIILLVCSGLLFFITQNTKAQSSNLHCKWISTSTSSVFLDSLLIEPSSIKVLDETAKEGQKILRKTQDYDFDFNTSKLTLKAVKLPDSLFVCYRTFPESISSSYHYRTLAEYDSNVLFTNKRIPKRAENLYQQQELFPTDNIYKSGSLSRGISFGNSQSLGVTSSLNFQMEGKLSENLNIKAVITDQNVPFQPEGNTQQLRDFDNVFVEVYNDKLSLRAGDVVLKSPKSNFLKYYKNVQGGQLNYTYKVGEKGKGKSSVSASAAKGQFSDVTIEVQEGVQGPYRLTDASTGQFVIVLANSEKVYLDGRLLKRGFSYDYIIDYNLGELTFNPSVLITRFSRVRATYEYSDRNYSRSILSASQQIDIGKTTFSFNFYREKDNRNQPLSFQLTDADKLSLSLAGEENLPAQISGEKETIFNENLLLYEKLDTVDLDGNVQTIFVFSRDSTATLYQVTFSDLGQGNGDYQLLDNTINGRIYEWKSPQLGVKQSTYASVLFVPAPNQKQMVSFAMEVQVSEHSKAYSEIAFSNQNFNLFSDIDAEDDKGMAVKSGYLIEQQPLNFLKNYKLNASIDFEYDAANFKAIDRFRYIEYDRDWSYQPEIDTALSADQIFNLSVNLKQNQHNDFLYTFSARNRGDAINGTQQRLAASKSFSALKLRFGGYLMNNERAKDKSVWSKYHAEAYFDKLFVVPGIRIEADQNEIVNLASDSVISTAFNYSSQKFYLRNNDTLKTKFNFEHIVRKDRQAFEGKIVDFSQSNTSNISFATNASKVNKLDIVFTYRTLKFLNDFAANEDEETVLGRLNWKGQFLKKHIRTNLTYATSSSRELRREFVFIPVVTGVGTHAWRDLNEDGIQDITEFFEAINFDERNYIKLFVPTKDFIAAFSNIFNLSLHLEMPKGWKTSSGLKQFLSKLSNTSTININKKNTDDSFNSRFNPFQLNTDDANVIFSKDAIRSTLFFNRSNPKFGLNAAYFLGNSKQLISNGIESRKNETYSLNTRINFQKKFTLIWDAATGSKANTSDFLEDRNYNIKIRSFSSQFVWQPKNTFRVTSVFSYKKKQNTLTAETKEFSEIKAVNLALRWNKAVKNSLDISFRYTNIAFEGVENTQAGYELLEALRPGNNLTWRLDYRQKLSNGLQINLGYEGRKSNNQRVIQIGRMQVTALF